MLAVVLILPELVIALTPVSAPLMLAPPVLPTPLPSSNAALRFHTSAALLYNTEANTIALPTCIPALLACKALFADDATMIRALLTLTVV